MMKKNALGSTFITTNIAHAIVGHYTQTAAQLETQFLDLETIAQTLYAIDIPYGTVLDFSMLTDKNGNAFKGVDSTGTWLVASSAPLAGIPPPGPSRSSSPAPAAARAPM